MYSILYRTLKKLQLKVMIGFSFILGVSSLITGDILISFPKESFLGYPASVFSFQLLVIPIPTLIIYRFLFPLFSSIAVGDTVAQDINTGYIKSAISHSTLKRYLTNHMFVSFFCGGIISILPVLVSMWGMLLFIPSIPLNRFYSMQLVDSQDFMPSIYYGHPFIYFTLRVAFIFVFGGALSLLSTIVSYLLKNRYLAIITPLFILMCIDMTIRIFRKESLTLTSQFIGTENLQWTGISFLLIIFLLSIFTVIQGVKKHEI
ncbi:hypothetical protein A5844_000848 [Enterococcus sp. 10A9_DIV0425]|uniref:Uncharacterized protein n=1 Tax=Candidatus Enterococcus wittei TaxID=1987383 RepID=A0A2C9XQX8_9ENTE|nr:hypothetical protein [Enterococcus sp. 10A9_DIV0425]OTP12615.1 hypothetical protein A5844_000848 [Enterococcus sp. 10A9_DIV0425]